MLSLAPPAWRRRDMKRRRETPISRTCVRCAESGKAVFANDSVSEQCTQPEVHWKHAHHLLPHLRLLLPALAIAIACLHCSLTSPTSPGLLCFPPHQQTSLSSPNHRPLPSPLLPRPSPILHKHSLFQSLPLLTFPTSSRLFTTPTSLSSFFSQNSYSCRFHAIHTSPPSDSDP